MGAKLGENELPARGNHFRSIFQGIILIARCDLDGCILLLITVIPSNVVIPRSQVLEPTRKLPAAIVGGGSKEQSRSRSKLGSI